jgi:pentatricopeptide repeat protein
MNLDCYSKLIKFYLQQKLINKVTPLFLEMKNSGLKINHEIFNSFLKYYFSQDNPIDAFNFYTLYKKGKKQKYLSKKII